MDAPREAAKPEVSGISKTQSARTSVAVFFPEKSPGVHAALRKTSEGFVGVKLRLRHVERWMESQREVERKFG